MKKNNSIVSLQTSHYKNSVNSLLKSDNKIVLENQYGFLFADSISVDTEEMYSIVIHQNVVRDLVMSTHAEVTSNIYINNNPKFFIPIVKLHYYIAKNTTLNTFLFT